MTPPRVVDLGDPRLAVYRTVRDPDLVRRERRFLAEGRLVVRTLLGTEGIEIESVLVSPTARAGIDDALRSRPDVTVLEIERGLLDELGAIRFHQGCLAAARRPPARTAADVVGAVPRGAAILVLEEVSNPDNVGTILRSGLALGAAGAVLSPGCASPYYRKALRASMGAALRLPFAHDAEPWEDSLDALTEAGRVLVGMTPAADAEDLERFVRRRDRARPVALVLGAEGAGLKDVTLARLDGSVRIPMAAGVDSLNVAAAAAIGLFALRGGGGAQSA